MFRKTIGAAFAAAVVVGVAALVRTILEESEKETDDEIHFIELEDEPKKKEVSPEVLEIAKIYPYLDTEFIAEQFARNDAFVKEYPEDTLVSISHKAKFVDAWTLQEYTKIAQENGYEATALSETENIITKKMFATDGAILSDIYNVANQVACLKGTYEGYKID